MNTVLSSGQADAARVLIPRSCRWRWQARPASMIEKPRPVLLSQHVHQDLPTGVDGDRFDFDGIGGWAARRRCTRARSPRGPALGDPGGVADPPASRWALRSGSRNQRSREPGRADEEIPEAGAGAPPPTGPRGPTPRAQRRKPPALSASGRENLPRLLTARRGLAASRAEPPNRRGRSAPRLPEYGPPNFGYLRQT